MVDDHRQICSDVGQSAHVFALASGYAAEYMLLEDGRRTFISIFVPGQIMNLEMILDPKASCSLMTLTAAHILRVPRKEMLALLETNVEAMTRFRMDLVRARRDLAERVQSLAGRSSVERTAFFIQCFFEKARSAGEPCTELPFKQEELADFLGISVVSVNRNLQALRRKGLIESRGRKIVVTDMAGLRKAAQSPSDMFSLIVPASARSLGGAERLPAPGTAAL